MPTQEEHDRQKVAEYQSAIVAVRIAATMLAQHELTEILRAIEFADSFGPVLDPTLWRDKHEAMEQDREVLKAALPLWKLGRKFAELAKEPG